MSSEVNGVNVSADNVFVCIKITSWVRVTRPRQVTAPTYSKNAAPLDQPPLPRKNPRSAPVPKITFFNDFCDPKMVRRGRKAYDCIHKTVLVFKSWL